MRKILFIGLVVAAVVLVSGCYGPTTSPNATVQPTGGTPGKVTPVTTPAETITPFIISTPVETATPVGTVTPVGITNVTGTPTATRTPTATGTPTAVMTVSTVNAIDIKSTAFDPAIISVPIGTTVTWTNRDNKSHTVKDRGFDSGSLDPGQTFSRTFNEAGSYDYSDPNYPDMSGTVIVT